MIMDSMGTELTRSAVGSPGPRRICWTGAMAVTAPRRVLDTRRNAALAVFRDSFAADSLGAESVGRQRDRLAMSFADGSQAMIHIASQKVGLPTGEFQLFPTFAIRRGPVRTVIDSLGLDPGTAFGDDKILLANLHAGGGRQGSYTFRLDTDIDRQARRMTLAIQRRFIPLISAFTGNYARAASFVIAEPRWVAMPWCTALTLFELAGAEAAAAELLARAAADPTLFADLAQIPDPAATAAQIRRTAQADLKLPK